MHKTLFLAATLVCMGIISCTDTNKTQNVTNNADTAILVSDPANSMQANPIKDTLIDTVHNR